MNNFRCGDSDHRSTDAGNSSGSDFRPSICDMADPKEVRQAFQHKGHHGHHGGHGHRGHSDHGNKVQGQLEFDNPYGNSDKHNWGCHGKDAQTGDQQAPGTTDTPATPQTPPVEVPAAPTASIAELTQLSEQMLPNHNNGSYPNTVDWERLHSANVMKAQAAELAGTNMVMYGDSITEAMGYRPNAIKPFAQDFSSDNPIAFGVGGDGTQQLLYRLNHGEMVGHPKTAVVMIGTNDIGSLSTQQIADNTSKIIESIQARSPETKVMLMGVLPRTGDPGNVQVDATNEALSHLATANGAVQFANLRDSFVDANGNEKPELYLADQLHLSDAGYQVWADGLKNAMDNAPVFTPTVPIEPTNPTYPSNPTTPIEPTNPTYPSNPTTPIEPTVPTVPTIPAVGGDNNGVTPLNSAEVYGVNLSGASWGPGSATDSHWWPGTKELDYYKSKGMNTVRLPIAWEQFQPTLNGPLDANNVALLDNFLREADARGMKVVVNLGNFNRYTLNHGPLGQGADGEDNGTVVGQPGVPVSAFQDFWSKLVTHVDSDPTTSRGVGGWDLTNEPFNSNGSWPSTATAADQAIRATGDTHTVVVEGDQWATDFSGLEGLAKADKNVVFSAHTYWDSGSGGYDGNQNAPADANIGVERIRPFVEWLKANDAQGFVGEWGVPTNNTTWDPAINNFVHYLKDNNVGDLVWGGGSAWEQGYTLNTEPINGQDRAVMSAIVQAHQD